MKSLLFSLNCLICGVIVCSTKAVLRSVKLDSIRFQSLTDKSTALNALHILSTVGILKITAVPDLPEAQSVVFSSLSSCLSKNYDSHATNDDIFETIMNDGTKRLTIGTKSDNGSNGRFMNDCAKSSKKLQDAVDLATQKLFEALDLSYSLSSSKSANKDSTDYIMKPYRNLTDVMGKGEHIEHLHSFYNTKTLQNDHVLSNSFDETFTMKMHTDLGLLIAMTTGYYSSNIKTESKRGLFITLPSQEIVHVDEDDLRTSDLIIMIGKGASDWLEPKSGVRFRAVPHALVVDLGNDVHATRSWYGKMFQPPKDAQVSQRAGLTYENLRGSMVESFVSNVRKATNDLKVSATRGYLETVQESPSSFSLMAATTCDLGKGRSGILCWMQCVNTTGYSCSSNQYLTCANNGVEVSGNRMNRADQLGCVNSPTLSPSANPSVEPSLSPTVSPSLNPTVEPSFSPTLSPSENPTVEPSVSPTVYPSIKPTIVPSVSPTVKPSIKPTIMSSMKPTVKPSIKPTIKPTIIPSVKPTMKPSKKPTIKPSIKPTVKPSISPTVKPSIKPTVKPTVKPSIKPTTKPSVKPTLKPTYIPSSKPSSLKPSRIPSKKPSIIPSKTPSKVPV